MQVYVARLGFPEGASLVGYTDDIVFVITVRNLEEAQRKLDVAMRRIVNWLREHSLQLATHKSEIKGRGIALLREYKERSDRRVSGASAHSIYIGMAF